MISKVIFVLITFFKWLANMFVVLLILSILWLWVSPFGLPYSAIFIPLIIIAVATAVVQLKKLHRELPQINPDKYSPVRIWESNKDFWDWDYETIKGAIILIVLLGLVYWIFIDDNGNTNQQKSKSKSVAQLRNDLNPPHVDSCSVLNELCRAYIRDGSITEASQTFRLHISACCDNSSDVLNSIVQAKNAIVNESDHNPFATPDTSVAETLIKLLRTDDLSGHNEVVHFARGICQFMIGSKNEARIDLERAISGGLDVDLLNEYLARIYFEEGKYSEAAILLSKQINREARINELIDSISKDGSTVEQATDLADLLLIQANGFESLDYTLTRRLYVEKNFEDIKVLRGICYLKLGKPDSALIDFKTLREELYDDEVFEFDKVDSLIEQVYVAKYGQ